MPAELLSIVRPLLMSAVAVVVGFPIARRSLALAWPIGLAALAIPLAIAGSCGLPLGPLAVAIDSVALVAFALIALRKTDKQSSGPSIKGEPVSAAIAFAAFALDVWKIVVTPLWSWDHFAIWGVKARLLGATHRFGSIAEGLHPEYPVGFPVVLHVLSGGEVPDQWMFRAIHILFLACVLLLVRTLVLQHTMSPVTANLSSAFLALTSVAWDTEAVGLADLPLVTFAVAACILAFGERADFGLALSLGFLPWVKQEGLPLAFFIMIAAIAVSRDRRRTMHAMFVAVIIAAPSLFVGVAAGTSFFAGNWWARATHRLRHPGAVLHELWLHLRSGATLGLWRIVPVALVWAVVRRERRAAALLSVVLAQMIVYCLVYFASFLPPAEHIRSSFHRIATALAPLVVAGVAIAIGRPRKG